MLAMHAVPELGTNPHSVFIWTGTVVQVNAASFTVALVLPWPLCHRGAVPHPNCQESGFQCSFWAPMSVILIMNSSLSPSTMRTIVLTSFPATYMLIRYQPSTFMAPLFALPNADSVSGSLMGRFLNGILLKATALINWHQLLCHTELWRLTNSQFYK